MSHSIQETEDAPFENVTKIDVAERQLSEAVLLFFERRDVVSIHTLTAAAHTVLMDLGKEKGVKSVLKDEIPVRPEMRKAFRSQLNAPQNYFKHADRDTYDSFDFYFGLTDFYLWDAIQMLMDIKGSIPKEMALFKIWFQTKHIDLFEEDPSNRVLQEFAKRLGPEIDTFEEILAALQLPGLPERLPKGTI